MAMGAACILFTMASCKGRTQENMTPNGDTVELDGQEVIDGGEVVMNPSTTDTTVIADSPAEANAQAAADKADSANAAKAEQK